MLLYYHDIHYYHVITQNPIKILSPSELDNFISHHDNWTFSKSRQDESGEMILSPGIIDDLYKSYNINFSNLKITSNKKKSKS